MVNPVNIADLEARFRPLTAEEQEVAQALLADAWAILLVSKPTLPEQIAAGIVSLNVVAFVESAMVLRVLRNPNGVKQWSVDDYSETRDASLAGGSLYVSDTELALLAPPGSGSGAAFTISPSNAGPGYRIDVPSPLVGWA